MFEARLIRLVIWLLPLAVSLPASAGSSVSWHYSLTSIGKDHYRYDFSFCNLGPDKDAIFKITIGEQAVSSKWITVFFENPVGWVGDHPGNLLEWRTANGDVTSAVPGVDRLWGQLGAPEGPGATSATFSWIFLNVGGPDPLDSVFEISKVKVHLQPIDAEWRNAAETYTTNPVPEPAGLLALLTGIVGTIGSIRRRRK